MVETIRTQYRELKQKAGGRIVAKRKGQHEVVLYEVGILDNLKRMHIWEPTYEYLEVPVLEWKDGQRSLTYRKGTDSFGPYQILSDYGPSWLVEDKDGQRQLVLKTDPIKWSRGFKGTPKDFGDSWLVEDKNVHWLLQKSDPSKQSSKFRGVPKDFGLTWLLETHDGGRLLVQKADLAISSRWLQGEPQDYVDSWLVKIWNGQRQLVLKTNPSRGSKEFARVVRRKKNWALVETEIGSIRWWISTKDLSRRAVTDKPPGDDLAN